MNNQHQDHDDTEGMGAVVWALGSIALAAIVLVGAYGRSQGWW